ncbi:MAG: bifunctional 2-C-methyl-D-erythritol 4-phosphate cytidylyltransferase/2-C-methyl-D-erythritol 2,4-cyclodiphosphate synthase [Campylobacter sp.]|nr:bifunctional 2-C-methyl-D-erythritol 4-phosphate cytidylyltransferase/2-C-methyl-D-erythritol 2,4-cyclodiphosphate synthase [Campylobacter sp.]
MLGAGESSRFELPVKKQWLRIDKQPLWLYASKNLSSFYAFREIIVVSKECEYMKKFAPEFNFIRGGETRQESLKNALSIVKSEYVLVSDIARPLISHDLFFKIINAATLAECVIPVLGVPDTSYLGDKCVDRSMLKLVQTPQLSQTEILRTALETSNLYTDESSAIVANGGKIWQIEGDDMARKITTLNDLKKLDLPAPAVEFFTGTGFDVHEFEKGHELWLGGIKIQHSKGLKAHSDGDVALHALCDAILGAAGLGDIGEHFPDSDDKFKGISSVLLLQEVYKKVLSLGFELVNADITIMAQEPKISPFKQEMEQKIAKTLGVLPHRINVKATTTEKLGFVGRKEGIATIANASLKYYDWMKK